ncbi:MAG TPA: hypothetical protein VHU18_09650 [Rhizomicrobium sp.]|jgi:hypothetical protein|nr:hypothetical protein [Rhizomicrobium sp.]
MAAPELSDVPHAGQEVPDGVRGRIGSSNYGMATGERIAHLSCLIARGLMRRSADAIACYETL